MTEHENKHIIEVSNTYYCCINKRLWQKLSKHTKEKVMNLMTKVPPDTDATS